MSTWFGGLAMAAWLGLAGCHGGSGKLGQNLPSNEADYDLMGEAMMRLDADKAPLQRLEPLVGDWLIQGEYQAWPDATLMTLKQGCETRWILSGTCLEIRYMYNIQGMQVMDLALLRWNPLEATYDMQMYSSGWPIPQGGPGHWNEETGTLDFILTTANPTSGKPIRTLYRLEHIDSDSHQWKQYRSGKGGKLVAFFTMTATRAPKE